MREEESFIIKNGKWKSVRKLVDVADPEGRIIRKDNRLPPEMENISAAIKQAMEQIGISDLKPGPAGAWSGTLRDTDQIRQLSAIQNVDMVIEGPEGARRVSVYPMMFPEQKEESRNDVGSLNSPGYFTSAEKSEVKKFIRHEGSKWNVYSHSGKRMGSYGTEAEAKKRLQQIEYFKQKEETGQPGAQAATQLAQNATQLAQSLQQGNLTQSQTEVQSLEQLVNQIKQSITNAVQAAGAQQTGGGQ